MQYILTLLAALPLLAAAGNPGNPASQLLWYDKPATNWQREALPIGNAHMGAMLFGGVER
ncbi:MAG: glycoside hydrolase N-terminal domain-containing protein, partial [Kiritimatiellaeota bacterium]|nr:glycoside hydrolase N-terminal domain-containing protein [Kiritimatiellota bacterium]